MDILFFVVAFLSSIVDAICGIGGGIVGRKGIQHHNQCSRRFETRFPDGIRRRHPSEESLRF